MTGADFAGLRDAAETIGSRFALGIVWYAGESVVRFTDGLYAVPIAAL